MQSRIGYICLIFLSLLDLTYSAQPTSLLGLFLCIDFSGKYDSTFVKKKYAVMPSEKGYQSNSFKKIILLDLFMH